MKFVAGTNKASVEALGNPLKDSEAESLKGCMILCLCSFFTCSKPPVPSAQCLLLLTVSSSRPHSVHKGAIWPPRARISIDVPGVSPLIGITVQH